MAETNNPTAQEANQVQLPEWVLKRLEKVDWNQLTTELGVDKDFILGNERIATQLANGIMTDLVPCKLGSIYGEISLSPTYSKDDDTIRCKGYTRQSNLSVNERMFVYGVEIGSEVIKKALCEKTGWEINGKRVSGYANANAGCQVTLDIKDHGKQKFLLSVHEPTNRVVAMSADVVRKWFDATRVDKETGEEVKYNCSKYGVQFSSSDIDLLVDGKRVFIASQNKDGEMFSCWLQYDVAKRDVVVCHPIQLTQKEAAHMTAKLNDYHQNGKRTESQKETQNSTKKPDNSLEKRPRKVTKR